MSFPRGKIACFKRIPGFLYSKLLIIADKTMLMAHVVFHMNFRIEEHVGLCIVMDSIGKAPQFRIRRAIFIANAIYHRLSSRLTR